MWNIVTWKRIGRSQWAKRNYLTQCHVISGLGMHTSKDAWLLETNRGDGYCDMFVKEVVPNNFS